MSEIRGGTSREKHFADNAEIAGSPISTGTNRMDQAQPGVAGMAGDDITSPSAGSVCTYVCWLGTCCDGRYFLLGGFLSFADRVLLAMIKTTTISFEFILKVGTRRASGTQKKKKNKKHAREKTKEPFEKILFSG